MKVKTRDVGGNINLKVKMFLLSDLNLLQCECDRGLISLDLAKSQTASPRKRKVRDFNRYITLSRYFALFKDAAALFR